MLLCITKTVRDEGLAKLPEIVNRYFDRAGIKAHPVRQNVYIKLRRRYLELANCSKFNAVTSDLQKVRNLYTNFLKVPELRKRLEKLKEMKHRNNLLPSEADMQILGEAGTLSSSHKVYFVTDDGDYISFKNEIEQELGVIIVELLELRRFAESLKSK